MAPFELSPGTERIAENLGYTLLVAVASSWLTMAVLDVDQLVGVPSLLGRPVMLWSIIVLFFVTYPLVSRFRAARSDLERSG